MTYMINIVTNFILMYVGNDKLINFIFFAVVVQVVAGTEGKKDRRTTLK